MLTSIHTVFTHILMILPLASKLRPVIWGARFDDILRDPSQQGQEWLRCSEEPWYWLVNYIWTIRRDENIKDAELARFPPDEYLRYVFHKCFVEPFFATDKSRQMRMTWMMMAYYVWYCQFRRFEFVTCQTKKEHDADSELIERAYVIWKHQPVWMNGGPPACKRTYCRLVFNYTESVMVGIPSGGDQIRSHNPSRHFGDECGFLEGEFDDCLSAALACCKDIKLVSTPNAGQWDTFINDLNAA